MDEIRCPMCSKMNPGGLEVCQYCQARLKPLIISPPPEEESRPVSGKSETPQQPISAQETGSDWLDTLRSGEQELTESENLSDWLEQDQDLPGGMEMGGDQPEPPEDDWLSRLGEKEDEAELSESPPEGSAADSQPTGEYSDPQGQEAGMDWLKDIRQSSPDVSDQADQEESSFDMDGEPEWLHRIRSRQSEGQDELTPEQIESQPADDSRTDDLRTDISAGLDAQEPLKYPEEEAPDWLSEIDALPPKGADQKRQRDDELVEGTPEKDQNLDFDWLEDTRGEQGEKEMAPGRTSDEVDDGWGSKKLGDKEELTHASASNAEENAQESDADNLTPAILPPWLESMRPIEAAASAPPPVDSSEHKIERTGPLAGLRGVLPAEPEIDRIKRPDLYTVKLQISETQKAHIATLNEMISQEGKKHPAAKSLKVSMPLLLRGLIFFLLIIAILAAGFLEKEAGEISSLPEETLRTSSLINNLRANSPVLVGVDYDPGLTGELEAVAGPVLDHLMLKSVYLTLVSSTPTGPLQAERLIKAVNATRGHQYLDENQYANLGYIPGGSIGLLAFAQTPQRVLPNTIYGSSIWDLSGLSSVKLLQDFSLAVVITDSPDKARAWIEQVQPALQGTPLVMILSAQAEPLVRPYFTAVPQQVQGMVTGLAGGMAYEEIISRAGMATSEWRGFSLGTLVGLILMILVGLFSGVAAWIARRQPTKGTGGA